MCLIFRLSQWKSIFVNAFLYSFFFNPKTPIFVDFTIYYIPNSERTKNAVIVKDNDQNVMHGCTSSLIWIPPGALLNSAINVKK